MQSQAALLTYAVLAVAFLVFLTARLKLSAFIGLIIVSIAFGLAAGLEPSRLMKAFQDGTASVLGSIAMIIALGTILGAILAESGGADVLAERIVALFGASRLGLAFFVIGLVVGLPVFFAVGLVLLIPIFNIATRDHPAALRIGLPMVAGLSAAHGLVPPHPGPLTAIELLHANMAKTLLYSLPIAATAGLIAGPILTRFYRDSLLLTERAAVAQRPSSQRPGFALTLATVLLPMGLIALGSIPFPALQLPGHPVTALLIGVIFAYSGLGRRFSREQLLRFSEGSLAPVAIMLLVIGAGAGFSRVLIEAGVGKAMADLATRLDIRAVPMGFVLAALVRIATGSATVAITTSAGLVKPIAEAQPGTNLELVVLAMGAGSLILSHVNDGGFWLVKEYLNLSVPQALKTWTVVETVLSLVAFGCVLLLDLIW